jgi:hypothetical protein
MGPFQSKISWLLVERCRGLSFEIAYLGSVKFVGDGKPLSKISNDR